MVLLGEIAGLVLDLINIHHTRFPKESSVLVAVPRDLRYMGRYDPILPSNCTVKAATHHEAVLEHVHPRDI